MRPECIDVLVGHLDAERPDWRDKIGYLAACRLIGFVRGIRAEPDRAHYQALYTVDFIEAFDRVDPMLLEQISGNSRWDVLEALLSGWITDDDVHDMACFWKENRAWFPAYLVASYLGLDELARRNDAWYADEYNGRRQVAWNASYPRRVDDED
ncbi:MAG: hypothetical protein KDB26_10410 [Microthrixaceae bacterium]|nr:hypothetical protein [Microthrixaceae bacterium]